MQVPGRLRGGGGDKVNSLKGVRFSFHRYRQLGEFGQRDEFGRYFMKSRGMNIIDDDEFEKLNCCFQNNVERSQNVRQRNYTEHYPEMEREDLKTLYALFDIDTPIGILAKRLV